MHVAQVPGLQSLIVFWVVVSCDSDAGVTVSAVDGRLGLEVYQARSGVCAPGTAATILELATDADLDASNVTSVLRYVDP